MFLFKNNLTFSHLNFFTISHFHWSGLVCHWFPLTATDWLAVLYRTDCYTRKLSLGMDILNSESHYGKALFPLWDIMAIMPKQKKLNPRWVWMDGIYHWLHLTTQGHQKRNFPMREGPLFACQKPFFDWTVQIRWPEEKPDKIRTKFLKGKILVGLLFSGPNI